MINAATLKVGDHLQSPAGSYGRVIRIENGTVFATYRDRGGDWQATYTPEWFKRYGDLLRRMERPA